MSYYIFIPTAAGLAVQLVNLIEVTRIDVSRRPNFKDWVYWLPYIIAPVLGEFTGMVFFEDTQTPPSAMLQAQVGALAPLLLKTFVSALPKGTNFGKS